MKQRGIIGIFVLILILVVAVAGGAYYLGRFSTKLQPQSTTPSPDPTAIGRISTKPQPTKTQQSTQVTPSPEPIANWKTYANTEKNFSLQYPSDWSVKIFNESSFILGNKADLELLTAEMLNHGWPGGMSIDISKTEYPSAELQKEGIEKNPWEENLNHYQFSKTTMGGKMANKQISLSQEDYIQFPYTSIGLNFKGHGWTVMFPNINYKGDHDKIYDQILSTFRFD